LMPQRWHNVATKKCWRLLVDTESFPSFDRPMPGRGRRSGLFDI
jgi:hypothetical protein